MISRRVGRGGQFMIWIVVGAALDAAALTILWLLLGASSPDDAWLDPLSVTTSSRSWLIVLAMIAVPWLVHVVALPVVLRVAWLGRDRLLARTAAFIALAAALIPIIEIAAVFCIGLPALLILSSINGPSHRGAAAASGWIMSALDYGFWMVIVTISGTVMGFLLHAFRPGGTMDRLPLPLPHRPRMRSDVLGGASAAFLAFGAVFPTSPFGLFFRSVGISAVPMYSRATTPQFAATITIGVVALLPHLLMVRGDLFFGADLRQEEVLYQPA